MSLDDRFSDQPPLTKSPTYKVGNVHLHFMNICTNNSTPKHSLSATNQATRELGDSQKFLQMRDFCPNCGSTNLSTGAGRKPGEMSLRCSECKAFIGYRDIGKLRQLQKLRRQKRTTDCLQFIQKNSGLTSDEAIFLLSEVGDLK